MPSFVADKVFLTGAPGTTLPAFGLGNVAAQVIPWLAAPSRPVYNILAYNNISPSQPGLNLGQVGRKFANVHARSIYPDKLGSLSNTIDITVMESQTPFRETVAWRFVPRSNVMDFKSMGGSLDARHVSCTSLDVGGVSVQNLDAATLSNARAYTDQRVSGMTPGGGGSFDLTRTNSIFPAADNTYDIGSNALRFREFHANRAYFSNVTVSGRCGNISCDLISAEEITSRGNVRFPKVYTEELLLKSGDSAYTQAFHVSNLTGSQSVIVAGASIAPYIDDTQSLGHAQLRYKHAFVATVNAGSLRVDPIAGLSVKALVPATSNETVSWRFSPDAGGKVHLVPGQDDDVQIGTTQNRVKDLHAKSATVNTLSVPGEAFLNYSPSLSNHAANKGYVDGKVAGDIVPSADGRSSLGSSTNKYEKVYANDMQVGAIQSLSNKLSEIETRLAALGG